MRLRENRAQGLKPSIHFAALAARLKSCPVTRQLQLAAEKGKGPICNNRSDLFCVPAGFTHVIAGRVPLSVRSASNRPASGDQVDDEDDHRHHQEQVDQAACNVQTEPENPKCQQDYKYRPKHSGSLSIYLPLRRGRMRPGMLSCAGEHDGVELYREAAACTLASWMASRKAPDPGGGATCPMRRSRVGISRP